ncbi:MAG: RNA polymerase II elongation factor [Cyphobasidiales sp. Tagirdzhanova-0007]|nr:MAG: RNA polymerase II elongation factor [Cyphobasidiales sp. Tagirdzhanova-0007]
MSSATAQILGLKKALATAASAGKTEEIKNLLLQLKADVKATEELLRETKIGLSVGKLRQNDNSEVASLAKELVKKWKEDVGNIRTKSESKDAGSPQSPVASTKPSPSPSLATGNGPPQPARKASAPVPNGSAAIESRPPPPSHQRSMSTHSMTGAGSPPAISGGEVRNTKTDNIDTRVTEDKTRNKCIELVYDSLAMDSGADSKLILERATEIESGTHRNIKDAAAYRTKMRSLYLNIKAKDNPELRASIVSGEMDGSAMWSMSAADMASAEKKAELAAMSREALFNAQAAAPKKSETDMFECGKCKKRRTTYYQMQTRSADEPMTTFVSCLNCGNNWRFS